MISPIGVSIGIGFGLALAVALTVLRNIDDNRPLPPTTKRSAVGLLLLVAAGVFLVHGSEGTLVRDEGVFVVASNEVAKGHLPYVAAFDNTGPLGPWLGGLGVSLGKLGGWHHIRAARSVYLPVALIAVAGTYFLGLRARLSLTGATIAALALMAIPSFAREALSGPRPKLLVVALLVGYLIALDRRRYTTAGTMLALATLTWQASFLFVLVPIIVALWRRSVPDRPWRATARFVAGVSIFPALVICIYIAAGQLPALVEGLITWNLRLGSSRLPSSLLDAFVNPLKDLWGAHQATWPLLVVGALAVLPLSRNLFDGRHQPGGFDTPSARDLMTVSFVVFIAWTVLDYQGVVDLFPFLPLAAVGAGTVGEHIWFRSRVWGIALLMSFLLAGLVDFARTHNTGLSEQRADLAVLADSGCVASYNEPIALAISGDSNPHRFFFTATGLDEHLGKQATTYIETLIASDPRFLGGQIRPRGPNLRAAVQQVLPAAGYRPVMTESFEGWLSPASVSMTPSCSE